METVIFIEPRATAIHIIDMLIKQGKSSMALSDGGECGPVCSYRGDNGTKCAIGIIMPDEIFHASFEGDSFSGLYTHDENGPAFKDYIDANYPALTAKVSNTDISKAVGEEGLGTALQRLHDQSAEASSEFKIALIAKATALFTLNKWDLPPHWASYAALHGSRLMAFTV